jgi:hypothetical protein
MVQRIVELVEDVSAQVVPHLQNRSRVHHRQQISIQPLHRFVLLMHFTCVRAKSVRLGKKRVIVIFVPLLSVFVQLLLLGVASRAAQSKGYRCQLILIASRQRPRFRRITEAMLLANGQWKSWHMMLTE